MYMVTRCQNWQVRNVHEASAIMVSHVDYCVGTQKTRHAPKSEPSWSPRPADLSEGWAEWA